MLFLWRTSERDNRVYTFIVSDLNSYFISSVAFHIIMMITVAIWKRILQLGIFFSMNKISLCNTPFLSSTVFPTNCALMQLLMCEYTRCTAIFSNCWQVTLVGCYYCWYVVLLLMYCIVFGKRDGKRVFPFKMPSEPKRKKYEKSKNHGLLCVEYLISIRL